jgi:4-amino-4-deoxy-L-arabinose transferase-like glycosyltransferase
MSGSPLFALIPLSAFVLFNLYFIGREAGQVQDWRRVFVLSSIAWGVYVVLVGEVLSLFEAVTTLWLAVAWRALRNGVTGLSPGGKALLGATALICGVLLGVALISPPNNVDSALYHMARVMHWAQNASLRPYPTIMEHQLYKPIWAESAILHMRVLWGSDTPANLVQWFSMVGSLVAVSGIASLLGARRAAQFLAVAFAVSIPMGILQSTSTQNDFVAAFWAVCLAYLVVLSVRRRLTGWELAALAASVGLGTLTKGTAFVYAPPFVAWFLVNELAARGVRRAVVAGLAVAAVAVLLNTGFWARNVAVYGGPYGSSQWLQANLWVRLLEEPSSSSLEPGAIPAVQATQAAPTIASLDDHAQVTAPATQAPPAVPSPDGQPLPTAQPSAERPLPRFASSLSSSLGNYSVRLAHAAGRNLTLPTGFLSRPMIAALESIPGVFGKPYADELRAVSWNSEDFAGNPLHLLFVPVSLALLLLSWRKPEAKFALAYSAVTLVTFAMIPIVIGHGPSIYGIRYQLSFFVLWAPVVGVAFGLVAKDRFLNILAAGFLLAALPWVLFNKSRPLIGLTPPRTVIGSILTENQAAMVLPWSPQLRDDYTLAAQAVLESGCTEVGLRADSDFLEYPLWWLLGAPQNGLRLESLETTSYLEPYVDRAFTPCAVVCANCLEGETPEGFALIGSFDSLNVFGAAE